MLLLLTILLSTGAFAQTIHYSYDAAGNRISRKYVVVELRSADASNEPADSSSVEAALGERKVFVYPNPTKGNLIVEVTGGDQEEAIDMKLFSAQGILLENISAAIGKTIVSMTKYPSGWYILCVSMKDKNIEFKVIKQ